MYQNAEESLKRHQRTKDLPPRMARTTNTAIPKATADPLVRPLSEENYNVEAFVILQICSFISQRAALLQCQQLSGLSNVSDNSRSDAYEKQPQHWLWVVFEQVLFPSRQDTQALSSPVQVALSHVYAA